ncbi:MAG: alpha/beta hydrolase [Chlamydiales bacterium]|nr:alpha/beta hydrolase [Chlamydiales bacterium]
MKKTVTQKAVKVVVDALKFEGVLALPPDPKGIVLFAHGSGSTHKSPRNQMVASFLHEEQIGTLLFDLLTPDEEKADSMTRELRFNIPLLSHRLIEAAEWVGKQEDCRNLNLAFFGASTGAAAALIAASEMGNKVRAVVSRGGRPDLAGQSLARVRVPVLLIVGGADYGVIEINERAFDVLECEKKFEIVQDATHLFDEEGALEEVGRMAAAWFSSHL